MSPRDLTLGDSTFPATLGHAEGQYLHIPRLPPNTPGPPPGCFRHITEGQKECSASTRVISLAASLCNINDVNPVGIATCHCKGRIKEDGKDHKIANQKHSVLFYFSQMSGQHLLAHFFQ